MSKFNDTENIEIDIENLKNSSTIGHILLHIKNKYPDWIKMIYPCFSNDYNILNLNWLRMCKQKFNTEPKDIIIVEQDEFKSNSTFLETSCDILTKCGFLIRNENSYIKCQNCDRLIPTELEIQNIKNINKKISLDFPRVWKPCCSECNKT